MNDTGWIEALRVWGLAFVVPVAVIAIVSLGLSQIMGRTWTPKWRAAAVVGYSLPLTAVFLFHGFQGTVMGTEGFTRALMIGCVPPLPILYIWHYRRFARQWKGGAMNEDTLFE